MRTKILLFTVSLGLLAGCTSSTAQIGDNPFLQSRYGDELADMLANIIINKDPILEKPGVRDMLEREINKAKVLGQKGHDEITQGLKGGFLPMKADSYGGAVYVNDTVHFFTDFAVKPGIDVHVFLTTVVDPRDGEFPDGTAVDLGPLKSPYGPQSYAVPKQATPGLLRTVVIWDNSLRYLYSFAQLSK